MPNRLSRFNSIARITGRVTGQGTITATGGTTSTNGGKNIHYWTASSPNGFQVTSVSLLPSSLSYLPSKPGVVGT